MAFVKVLGEFMHTALKYKCPVFRLPFWRVISAQHFLCSEVVMISIFLSDDTVIRKEAEYRAEERKSQSEATE